MVMTTNNIWLLKYAPHLPVIMCEQRSAPKCPVEWKHFVDANIAAAGDDIGAITNRCTAMYDKFTMTDDPELKKILEYRIQCSQHFQQNAIDKAKGVVTKPQNKEWYDLHALAIKEGDSQEDIARKEFNRKLVVNRKPYFMRYVYADTMREWKDFVCKTQDNCLRFFRMTLEQLREYADMGKATPEQLDFLVNYEKYMPVSDGNCVVNRICHYIENEFEPQKDCASDFDSSILKGGLEATDSQKKQISQLYKDYTGDMRHVMDECKRQHVDNDERKRRRMAVREYYMERCGSVCSNAEQLCNAMVDVCYKANTSKAFVWDVCGDQLVTNLMAHGDGCLHYPMRDDNGIILYKGHRYTMKTVEVNNDNTEREGIC